ncbi:uncharacterized protein LOC125502457 [Dendroctonus ponderosae]|uniref:uncharacterized protein LOC125502457 n=1 Tax=Dendroctonus ponderosae TaxID=77166 RepID=UPI002035761C|nr:uncharacterized protein LOC125502457 [Dendroctonus ponderosae]
MTGRTVIHLISTYAPDMYKPTEESEIFYEKFQNTVNKINNGHKIVILEDLNARIGNEEIRGVKQRFNEAVINENGELLIDSEQAAEEAIGKRKININANNRTKPWFCQEVKQLADIKRSNYLKYKNLQTIEQQAEYIQTRNRVNSKIKEIKREYWIKFTADMEYDMYGAQRNVWKLLKNRKKPVNEYAQTEGVSMETSDSFTNLKKQ